MGLNDLKNNEGPVNQDPMPIYEFGPFQLDTRKHILSKAEQTVESNSKAVELLMVLVERAGSAVKTEDLSKQVWGSRYVGSNSIAQCVHHLREILDDDAKDSKYIATVPRVGYRFIATVKEREKPCETESLETKELEPGNIGSLTAGVLGYLGSLPDMGETTTEGQAGNHDLQSERGQGYPYAGAYPPAVDQTISSDAKPDVILKMGGISQALSHGILTSQPCTLNLRDIVPNAKSDEKVICGAYPDSDSKSIWTLIEFTFVKNEDELIRVGVENQLRHNWLGSLEQVLHAPAKEIGNRFFRLLIEWKRLNDDAALGPWLVRQSRLGRAHAEFITIVLARELENVCHDAILDAAIMDLHYRKDVRQDTERNGNNGDHE